MITVSRKEREKRREKQESVKQRNEEKGVCLNHFPAYLLPHTALDSLLKSFV